MGDRGGMKGEGRKGESKSEMLDKKTSILKFVIFEIGEMNHLDVRNVSCHMCMHKCLSIRHECIYIRTCTEREGKEDWLD